MNKKTSIARKLRKNLTKQENLIWQLLRKKAINGFKFRRQYPIGKYVVDFVCLEAKLVIEVDGGQHNTPENINYDNERTCFIKSQGYKVLRFWNNEIDDNIEGVFDVIASELKL